MRRFFELKFSRIQSSHKVFRIPKFRIRTLSVIVLYRIHARQ